MVVDLRGECKNGSVYLFNQYHLGTFCILHMLTSYNQGCTMQALTENMPSFCPVQVKNSCDNKYLRLVK